MFKFTFTLLAGLCLASASALAQTTVQGTDNSAVRIAFDRVEARQLFGGLGDNSGPMGEITELFVAEEQAPLFYFNEDQTSFFSSKTIDIYAGKVCLADAPSQCLPCDSCVNFPDKLALYDVHKGAPGRQQLRYTVRTGAASYPAQPGPGDVRVELSVLQAGAAPATITGNMPSLSTAEYLSRQFQGKAYLFASAAQPSSFFICPSSTFSLSCMVCDDCSTKEPMLAKLATFNPK